MQTSATTTVLYYKLSHSGYYNRPIMASRKSLDALKAANEALQDIQRHMEPLLERWNNNDDNPDAATGFMFEDYNRDVFAETTERAIKTYGDKNVWSKLMQNGMTCDFSWNRSAAKYVDVYRRASERISGRAAERRS